MPRSARSAVSLAGLLALLALGGCTRIEGAMASVPFLDFMHNAPWFDPYEAPRVPPANSVPVAGPGEKWEPHVDNTDAAIKAWGDTMANPRPMSDAVLNEGAHEFQTFCAVCHGVHGEGDGPLVGTGKLPFATNLMLQTTIDRTDGYIYGMIREGRGLMPSYRRIPPSQRWAIVNYVRHLQNGGDPIPVQLPGLVQPGMDPFNTSAPADTAQGQE
jgi:mono/diheme cytochrome c family protein